MDEAEGLLITLLTSLAQGRTHMTPEERLEAHEQWLHDHDRAITQQNLAMAQHVLATARDLADIRAIQRQQAEVQQRQSEALLEIAQHMARLLDREDGEP